MVPGYRYQGPWTVVPVHSEGRLVDTGRTVLGYFFQYKPAKMATEAGLAGRANFFQVPTVGFGTSGFRYNIGPYLGYVIRVFWVFTASPSSRKKIARFVHLYLENSYWIYRYKFYRNFRQGSICTTQPPKNPYFFTIIVW